MKIILGLAAASAIAAASAPAYAQFDYYHSKLDFTHEATGYEVQGRRSASGVLHLKGANPATGKSFVLKVSRRGHITGVWEGASVDRWLGEDEAPQVLAQSDVAQSR